MTFVFVLVGLLLCLAGLGAIFYRVSMYSKSVENRRGPTPPSFTASAGIILAGVFCMAFTGMWYYVEPGKAYLVQFPWGTMEAQTEPGYHMAFFAKTEPFNKFVTVAFDKDQTGGDSGGGASSRPQEVRFNDSVTADVSMTARFALPTNQETFKELAVAYRTQDNLVHSSLIPIMKESMRNAARMLSAQEYIGGKGGEFESAVLEQIKGGIYLLEIEEDRSYADTEAFGEDGQRTVTQGQTTVRTVRKKLGKDGLPLRKEGENNVLSKFQIQLVQANVSDVDPDPDFKDKLKKQRDAAAQVAIERQKTRQEDERKKRIIAQGEAEKAEKRIELEKQQIDAVLTAETAAKKAKQEQIRVRTEAQTESEQKVIREKGRQDAARVAMQTKDIELETARKEAQRIKAIADANAYERKKMLEADGGLKLILEAQKSINKDYAAAIAKMDRVVPEIVIGGQGGTGGSANDFIQMMMLNQAKTLQDSITSGRKTLGMSQSGK